MPTVTIGADLNVHAPQMVLTRVAGGVQIDGYVDGTLRATAVDNGTVGTNLLYTNFNTWATVWTGTGAGHYRYSDVTLATSVGEHLVVYVDLLVAVNDSYNVNINTIFTNPAPGVLANDLSTTNLPLTASKVTNPTNGTLIAFNSDGSFIYQPSNNVVGLDIFTYKVNDGYNNSAAATVSLNIKPLRAADRRGRCLQRQQKRNADRCGAGRPGQ